MEEGPTSHWKKGTVHVALNSTTHSIGGNNFLNCNNNNNKLTTNMIIILQKWEVIQSITENRKHKNINMSKERKKETPEQEHQGGA